jgi:hypothetical protein
VPSALLERRAAPLPASTSHGALVPEARLPEHLTGPSSRRHACRSTSRGPRPGGTPAGGGLPVRSSEAQSIPRPDRPRGATPDLKVRTRESTIHGARHRAHMRRRTNARRQLGRHHSGTTRVGRGAWWATKGCIRLGPLCPRTPAWPPGENPPCVPPCVPGSHGLAAGVGATVGRGERKQRTPTRERVPGFRLLGGLRRTVGLARAACAPREHPPPHRPRPARAKSPGRRRAPVHRCAPRQTEDTTDGPAPRPTAPAQPSEGGPHPQHPHWDELHTGDGWQAFPVGRKPGARPPPARSRGHRPRPTPDNHGGGGGCPRVQEFPLSFQPYLSFRNSDLIAISIS